MKCPFEILLKMAEKLKYKMPIAIKEEKFAETPCWKNIFKSNLSNKYRNVTQNNQSYFMAPYTAEKREK